MQFKKNSNNLLLWMERKMRKDLLFPMMLATLVLAAIFVIAPRTAIVVYESSAEMSGIDIAGLTRNATNLSEQRFAAY